MYGLIFQEWINPQKCDIWAWTDFDIVFGDIKGWIDRNSLVWGLDVFSVSALDYGDIYTRGQFTAHVQNTKHKNRKNVDVNNLWKYCDRFRDLDFLANEFAEGSKGQCMDEGCYGRAVVDSGARFGLLPWYPSL